MKTIYERVFYDHDREMYCDAAGLPLTFAKALRVRLDGEEIDTELSYTRSVDEDTTSKPVPCLKLEGVKLLLSDDDLEIASDCIRLY
jgi:hypothetical protein